jgi:hypothetical protein
LNKIKIDFPDIQDINQILSVQNLVLLKNKNIELDHSINEKGFLVNEINKNDLRYAIEHNRKESFITIAKNTEGEIIGYFLAYDMKDFIKKHPNWFNETGVNFEVIKDKKVLYGKHLASDGTTKGIGRALEIQMYGLVKNMGYSLCLVEICEGPIKNDKSLGIHTNKFSMKKISA